jgi:hypothetical protein
VAAIIPAMKVPWEANTIITAGGGLRLAFDIPGLQVRIQPINH